MSQNGTKTTLLMTSLNHKKSVTPKQKFFFECNLLDRPIGLNPWTAL